MKSSPTRRVASSLLAIILAVGCHSSTTDAEMVRDHSGKILWCVVHDDWCHDIGAAQMLGFPEHRVFPRSVRAMAAGDFMPEHMCCLPGALMACGN